MKKKRYLLTIVLAVGCLIAFWYASTQDFFRSEPENVRLFDFTVDGVAEYAMQTEQLTMTFLNNGEHWSTREIPDLPLDDTRVRDWLFAAAGVSHEGIIEEDAEDVSGFGLRPAKKSFRIVSGDGTVQTLLIGNPLPVRGHSYGMLEGSNTVYRVPDEQISQLSKTEYDFIQRRLITYDLTKLKTIEMKIGPDDEGWKLDRQGGPEASFNAPWVLNGYDRQYLDISGILGQTLYMTTEEMIKRPDEVELFPVLHMWVSYYAGEELVTKRFDGTLVEDTVWMKEEHGQWVYGIDIDRIDRLYNTVFDSLGDEYLEDLIRELEELERLDQEAQDQAPAEGQPADRPPGQ